MPFDGQLRRENGRWEYYIASPDESGEIIGWIAISDLPGIGIAVSRELIEKMQDFQSVSGGQGMQTLTDWDNKPWDWPTLVGASQEDPRAGSIDQRYEVLFAGPEGTSLTVDALAKAAAAATTNRGFREEDKPEWWEAVKPMSGPWTELGKIDGEFDQFTATTELKNAWDMYQTLYPEEASEAKGPASANAYLNQQMATAYQDYDNAIAAGDQEEADRLYAKIYRLQMEKQQLARIGETEEAPQAAPRMTLDQAIDDAILSGDTARASELIAARDRSEAGSGMTRSQAIQYAAQFAQTSDEFDRMLAAITQQYQPQQPAGPTPEQLRQQRLADIRQYIQPAPFPGGPPGTGIPTPPLTATGQVATQQIIPPPLPIQDDPFATGTATTEPVRQGVVPGEPFISTPEEVTEDPSLGFYASGQPFDPKLARTRDIQLSPGGVPIIPVPAGTKFAEGTSDEFDRMLAAITQQYQPQQPAGPTPEQLRQQRLADIRQYIQPAPFPGGPPGTGIPTPPLTATGQVATQQIIPPPLPIQDDPFATGTATTEPVRQGVVPGEPFISTPEEVTEDPSLGFYASGQPFDPKLARTRDIQLSPGGVPIIPVPAGTKFAEGTAGFAGTYDLSGMPKSQNQLAIDAELKRLKEIQALHTSESGTGYTSLYGGKIDPVMEAEHNKLLQNQWDRDNPRLVAQRQQQQTGAPRFGSGKPFEQTLMNIKQGRTQRKLSSQKAGRTFKFGLS